MNARDRSTILRMAGNIAAGVCTRPAPDTLTRDTLQLVAETSVSIALRIHGDPRLQVTSEPIDDATEDAVTEGIRAGRIKTVNNR